MKINANENKAYSLLRIANENKETSLNKECTHCETLAEGRINFTYLVCFSDELNNVDTFTAKVNLKTKKISYTKKRN